MMGPSNWKIRKHDSNEAGNPKVGRSAGIRIHFRTEFLVSFTSHAGAKVR